MPKPNLGIGFFLTISLAGMCGLLCYSPIISWLSILFLPFLAGFVGGLYTINKIHGIIIGGVASFIGYLSGSVLVIIIFLLPENEKSTFPTSPIIFYMGAIFASFFALVGGAFGGYIGANQNMKSVKIENQVADSYYQQLYPEISKRNFIDYHSSNSRDPYHQQISYQYSSEQQTNEQKP